MALTQQHFITIEDYEALPEDIRAEIYEGQIKYMAAPSKIHQTILLELSSTLNSYVNRKKERVKFYPLPLM